MSLTYNEILIYVKKKSMWVIFVILTLGILATSVLSVSQGARYMENNQIIEGKEAILNLQEKTMEIEGLVTNEQINSYLDKLYLENQKQGLSSDEMINRLFSKDYIPYISYTNLLLDVYETSNYSSLDTYVTLFHLGNQTVDFYNDWKLKVVENGMDVSSSQRKDLRDKAKDVDTPFYYEVGVAPSIMIKKFQDLMLLLFIILAIIFASVFSKDMTTRADQVIMSTQHGRRNLRKARCNAACIISIILFLYTVLLYSAVIISQIGGEGFSTSIQMSVLSLSPYQLNIGQAFLIMIIAAFIMNMVITMIILFVSSKTKKAYYVILVAFILLFLSYMVTQTVAFDGVMRYLLMFLPFALFDKIALFSYNNIVFNSFSIWYPLIVMIVFLLIMIILRYRIVCCRT